MAYRNKTYICFDGDNDMQFYRLMTAWSSNENIDFEFYNAHDLNTSRDDSLEESIKNNLRIRLNNSKTFVVLIGEHTRYLRKFVKWEMEVALKMSLPIIGVNLNGSRFQDDRCPPTIRGALAVYVPFGASIVQYALRNWPSEHKTLSADGNSGPRYYLDKVYYGLGIK